MYKIIQFPLNNASKNMINSIPKLNISTNSVRRKDLHKHRQEIMSRGLPKRKPIDGVKNIVLVSSGKGGVGKSTISVNLATALKRIYPHKSIGLLDTDVFGPSVPIMMNLNETPLLTDKNQMIPLTNYDIKCMSMGFLVDEKSPIIWRGLMVMQAIEKLTRQVDWGQVDCLIVDTPPGTGDTHLSLVQSLPIAGVVLVTTPQPAALQVTERGANMYRKLEVPLIGLVENMCTIQCPNCHENVHLYENGTEKLAKDLNIDIIAQLSIESSICAGQPVVVSHPESLASGKFTRLAKTVAEFIKI